MHRLSFYEVKPEAYLFPNIRILGKTRKNLEEPVRQWCAFELIRAYGISIDQLAFEHPVKVGSKKYGIDILVTKDRAPWLVIECKAPGYKVHDKALEQAISYAEAQTIRAEFVVYTNGFEWMVKRKINGEWVSVPDLPRVQIFAGTNSILSVLRTLDELCPLLYALDSPLKDQLAAKFLCVLQRFFCGENQITQGTNQNLRSALEKILRVIGPSPQDRHPDYQAQKLAIANTEIMRFQKQTRLGYEIDIDEPGSTTYDKLRSLHQGVVYMASGNSPAGTDSLLLRLLASVLECGVRKFDPRQPAEEIGPNLHHSLRAYLAYISAVYLDVSFPDSVDNGAVEDLRMLCHVAWENGGTFD